MNHILNLDSHKNTKKKAVAVCNIKRKQIVNSKECLNKKPIEKFSGLFNEKMGSINYLRKHFQNILHLLFYFLCTQISNATMVCMIYLFVGNKFIVLHL